MEKRKLKNKKKQLKSQVTVASVIVLLFVMVTVSITFVYWFTNFSVNFSSKFEGTDTSVDIFSIKKVGSNSGILSLKSGENSYQLLKSVVVNGVKCNLTDSNVFDDETTEVGLECDLGTGNDLKDIVVTTNYGLFDEVEVLKE